MAFLFQVKRKIRSSKKVSEIVDKGNGYKMWFFSLSGYSYYNIRKQSILFHRALLLLCCNENISLYCFVWFYLHYRTLWYSTVAIPPRSISSYILYLSFGVSDYCDSNGTLFNRLCRYAKQK